MGGAIAVHVAVQKLLSSLAGLAVIDVVEGKQPKVASKIIYLSDKNWNSCENQISSYTHVRYSNGGVVLHAVISQG